VDATLELVAEYIAYLFHKLGNYLMIYLGYLSETWPSNLGIY
jgi:hypothetical protein